MAQLTLLKGKIHRCTVTQADLDYEGSVTISEELMEAASIIEHEQVHIWNVTTAGRITTYAMRGPRNSGVICINGAAAHLFKPGDLAIIAAFTAMEHTEAMDWKPSVVLVDSQNRIRETTTREIPGPQVRHRDSSAMEL
jgi:aspartate 1-decarboxylase